MVRTLLLTLCGIATLSAQDAGSAIPRNEKALQNAIAGLGKYIARQAAAQPQQVRVSGPASGVCSVPLKEMPVTDPEQFTMRVVPRKNVAPMPQVAVPAPPCESAPR